MQIWGPAVLKALNDGHAITTVANRLFLGAQLSTTVISTMDISKNNPMLWSIYFFVQDLQ